MTAGVGPASAFAKHDCHIPVGYSLVTSDVRRTSTAAEPADTEEPKPHRIFMRAPDLLSVTHVPRRRRLASASHFHNGPAAQPTARSSGGRALSLRWDVCEKERETVYRVAQKVRRVVIKSY